MSAGEEGGVKISRTWEDDAGFAVAGKGHQVGFARAGKKHHAVIERCQ
jgi:hypothetical protein